MGTLEEFRKRDVDREEIPPGGFAVALDESTDEVIGYASRCSCPARRPAPSTT